MRRIGRQLQIAGLVVLPLGMLLQIDNRVTVGQMLAMTVGGACLFGIGWIAERYSGA